MSGGREERRDGEKRGPMTASIKDHSEKSGGGVGNPGP